MKLTAATLDTLTLPPGVAEKKYFDERLPGHGVRLRHPSDRSKWRWITQVDINGRTQVQTHGPVTLLDPGAAFKRSKDLLASVRLGHDPAAEKRQARERAAETFGALLKRYLPYKQARVRPRSYKEIERHLEKYARPLHTRSIATLDRRAIAALKSAIAAKAGPTAADTMHGSISSYCTWLIREGLLEGANPASLINKAAQGKGRDRVLSLAEVCEIWDALPPSGDDYGDIVRLLFYILARKTEVGALQWDEVDFDTAEIRLPASRPSSISASLKPVRQQGSPSQCLSGCCTISAASARRTCTTA